MVDTCQLRSKTVNKNFLAFFKYVCSHNFKHRRLDVAVCDALNVAVSAFFVPYLKGLTTDAV
jgi:hypothetical protein